MREYLEPEVLTCYFDDGFNPPLAAMRLRWHSEPFVRDRLWLLPGGVQIVGPAPQSFGLAIRRSGFDEYHVCLLWSDARFSWPALRRAHLQASSLGAFLQSIGTELAYLLQQPIMPDLPRLDRSAAA